LWSGYDLYFRNPLLKLIARPIVWYLRKLDVYASKSPGKIIAISSEVKKRIKKYYHQKSVVIFPPLYIKKAKIIKPKVKNYFLIVSRLVYYKRIDIAIKTFNDLGLPLVIVGSGGEEDNLKRMAKDNIKFVKNITDAKLFGYYKNSKALIFPGIEDFGIVMVEAQYFGKPVIAFRA
jgi:glycosyltransferase involved in cell wall biosynthesis